MKDQGIPLLLIPISDVLHRPKQSRLPQSLDIGRDLQNLPAPGQEGKGTGPGVPSFQRHHHPVTAHSGDPVDKSGGNGRIGCKGGSQILGKLSALYKGLMVGPLSLCLKILRLCLLQPALRSGYLPGQCTILNADGACCTKAHQEKCRCRSVKSPQPPCPRPI